MKIEGWAKKIDGRACNLTYQVNLSHLAVLHFLALFGYNKGWGDRILSFVAVLIVSAFFFILTDKPLQALRARLRGHTL
jgi:peptidoglycan/LPS O-acetylase OafA/YrhL